MPYADPKDRALYNRLWYGEHREEHLKKMIQYYYDHRTKILRQNKIKYKQSKNKRRDSF